MKTKITNWSRLSNLIIKCFPKVDRWENYLGFTYGLPTCTAPHVERDIHAPACHWLRHVWTRRFNIDLTAFSRYVSLKQVSSLVVISFIQMVTLALWSFVKFMTGDYMLSLNLKSEYVYSSGNVGDPTEWQSYKRRNGRELGNSTWQVYL